MSEVFRERTVAKITHSESALLQSNNKNNVCVFLPDVNCTEKTMKKTPFDRRQTLGPTHRLSTQGHFKKNFLDHWSQTQILEGRCPAEFSSNLN